MIKRLGLLDGYLTRVEAARQLRLSPRTLDRWSSTRFGPPRTHVGHKIYYREAAIRRCLSEREELMGRKKPMGRKKLLIGREEPMDTVHEEVFSQEEILSQMGVHYV